VLAACSKPPVLTLLQLGYSLPRLSGNVNTSLTSKILERIETTTHDSLLSLCLFPLFFLQREERGHKNSRNQGVGSKKNCCDRARCSAQCSKDRKQKERKGRKQEAKLLPPSSPASRSPSLSHSAHAGLQMEFTVNVTHRESNTKSFFSASTVGAPLRVLVALFSLLLPRVKHRKVKETKNSPHKTKRFANVERKEKR
jgi:hypothetical protein